MKNSVRKLLYGSLIICCAAFTAFIFYNGKTKVTFPELLERKGELANAPEWEQTQQTVQQLLISLKNKPTDTRSMLLLAKAFMQEGRVTGNFSYYNKAALDLTNAALKKEPSNLDALCYKAMIYLSQHRFAEGKTVAEQALAINPHNAFIYGLLVDANVELGDYTAAVEMSDKMVGVRPDIRSYSRISYLREIYGDPAGSIEAIQEAIAAGYPGSEDTEWARMVLAHLYEDTGHPDLAEAQYKQSFESRNGYPFALAGLGKIARYRKDYPTAIQYLERAKTAMADISFFEELIDLYRLNKQPEQADACAKILEDALLADQITAGKNKDSGHYSDRELSTLYLKMNDLPKALEYAQNEQRRRPDNIDACESLAWAYYKNGKIQEAAALLPTILKTKSQNPERLVKCGLIQVANGSKETGTAMVRQGLQLKPYMDETLALDANNFLHSHE